MKRAEGGAGGGGALSVNPTFFSTENFYLQRENITKIGIVESSATGQKQQKSWRFGGLDQAFIKGRICISM